MIIKPSCAGKGGPALARYLTEGKNERSEILDLRNTDAPNLGAAIYDMDRLARGSQCRNHTLHIQLRAAPGEEISADQWRDAADRIAALFGMEEHQAALVLHHQPDGAAHAHLVFNRVHPDTLKAADLWQSKKKCMGLARELEQDWGLRQLDSQNRHPERDYSREGQPETEQARRQGQNVHDLREHIRQLWENSANGKAFADALEAEGYQLATGDKRDYVVLDATGSPYSLGQRTTGAKAKAVREKLQDLDRDQVPDITEGRRLLQERQQERQHQRERKGRGEASAKAPEPTPSPSMVWETVSTTPEIEAEESRLLAVRLAEIERPTVGLWKATRGREATTQAPAPPKPASLFSGLALALMPKDATPTSTPPPARPSEPSNEQEQQPQPNESRIARLMRKRDERWKREREEARQQGRSRADDWLDDHNTPRGGPR